MPELPIRVSAKGVIVSGDRVLLTRNLHPEDPGGEFYLLPGGGQHHGESLAACVRREVHEETGYSIVPGDVLWIRDYIGASHEFASHDSDAHQVEVMFSCSIDTTTDRSEPTEPDAQQLSAEWVSIDRLGQLRIFPAAIVSHIVALAAGRPPQRRYLGDVN